MSRVWLALIGIVLLVVQAPLSAAITITEAIAESTTSNATSYASTASMSLAAGEVGLCAFGHSDADAIETVASLTWTTGGEAWTEVRTQAGNAAGNPIRITTFRYVGSHSSSTLTAAITGGADAQTGAAFHCVVIAGADTTTPIIQGKGADLVNTLDATLTLDSARTANSAVVAFLYTLWATSACTITAEYTAGTEASHSTPSTQNHKMWTIGGSDTTPTFTLTVCASGTDSVLVAEEIAVSGGGGGGGATGGGLLLRRVGE